jgi:hypothetical protein
MPNEHLQDTYLLLQVDHDYEIRETGRKYGCNRIY